MAVVMVSCGGGSHGRLRGAAVTVVVVDTSSSSLFKKKKSFPSPVLVCSFSAIQRSCTKAPQ